MGKIIRNNIEYSSSSNSAGNISYDNSASDLNSLTVQNAITELDGLVGEKLTQYSVMPTASAEYVGKVVQFIGTTNQDYTNGYFYVCVQLGTMSSITYSWINVNVTDIELDTTPTSGSSNPVTSDGIKTALDTKQNVMQYATMPTITASMLGKVVQYVGTSDSNYKQGWNYVAVSDGAAEPTYSWKALMDSAPTSGSNNPVTSDGIYKRTPFLRPTGGNSAYLGYGSTISGTGTENCLVAANASTSSARNCAVIGGTSLWANHENMTVIGKANSPKARDYFEIGNGADYQHRSNIVEVNSTEMNVNGDIQRDGVGIDDYTATERKIGKWIDGSDLYQRTFEVTSTIHNDGQYYDNILGTSDSGINIVDFEGFVEFTDTDVVQRFSLHQSFGDSDYILFFVNNSDLTSRIKFVTNFTLSRAVITIKYTKPSVQELNANLIPSDNPFNVSVMESSETPTSNEEPADEMR